MLRIAAGPVELHIALVYGDPPQFLQHLQCGLVPVQHIPPMQCVIDRPQPGVRILQTPLAMACLDSFSPLH